MANEVIRWYIDGTISRDKEEVGGVYTLVKNCVPDWVNLTVRVAGQGSLPLQIDIKDDGVSIFDSDYLPALTENMTEHKWTTIPANKMRKGSKITCDINQTYSGIACRDLTIELGVTTE